MVDKIRKGYPEFYLLVLLLRSPDSFKSEDQRGQLLKEAASCCKNWDYFLKITCANSVIPLVYINIIHDFPDLIPKEILGDLRIRFTPIAWTNLDHASELLRIQETLHSHGIQIAAYKGPVLASHLYGDLAYREFVDLDIFVEHGQIHDAQKILFVYGYQSTVSITFLKSRVGKHT